MKKSITLLMFILLVMTSSKCKNQANQMDNKDLYQSWTHSHEEDNENGQVFRPSSYNFPPSRGRQSFELKSDGSLITKGPGPSDRPEIKKGNWSIDDNTIKLTFTDEQTKSYNIVELSKEKLILKPQNP